MYTEKNLNALLDLFDKLPMSLFAKDKQFNESWLREWKDFIDWRTIDNTDSFSVEFIREFAKELDFEDGKLSEYTNFP